MPKQGIHPSYNATNVKCACGNTFETRSTHKGDILLEICSVCHPFYTGKSKVIDTAGRIERFKRKFAKSDRRRLLDGEVGQRDLVLVGDNRLNAAEEGLLKCAIHVILTSLPSHPHD